MTWRVVQFDVGLELPTKCLVSKMDSHGHATDSPGHAIRNVDIKNLLKSRLSSCPKEDNERLPS